MSIFKDSWRCYLATIANY